MYPPIINTDPQLRIYPNYEPTLIIDTGPPIINTGLRLGAYPQLRTYPPIKDMGLQL